MHLHAAGDTGRLGEVPSREIGKYLDEVLGWEVRNEKHDLDGALDVATALRKPKP